MVNDEIINFIKTNRVTTTEVADVLGKTGAIEGIHAVNRGHFCVGSVKYVYAYNESNWSIHEQIRNIEENRIVFIEEIECNGRALFGELVSKYLLLYRQSKAIVALGNIRDVAEIYRENWPIWCKGFSPVGCFNKKNECDSNELIARHKSFYDGAIAVCDDCGVVVIPKDKINEELLIKLKAIEDQEDIWFDRLNHYKESTFEIVCEKKYLDDVDYMSTRKNVF